MSSESTLTEAESEKRAEIKGYLSYISTNNPLVSFRTRFMAAVQLAQNAPEELSKVLNTTNQPPKLCLVSIEQEITLHKQTPDKTQKTTKKREVLSDESCVALALYLTNNDKNAIFSSNLFLSEKHSPLSDNQKRIFQQSLEASHQQTFSSGQNEKINIDEIMNELFIKGTYTARKCSLQKMGTLSSPPVTPPGSEPASTESDDDSSDSATSAETAAVALSTQTQQLNQTTATSHEKKNFFQELIDSLLKFLGSCFGWSDTNSAAATIPSASVS
jgi:hypothetical protein